jgi:ABC-type antimicrobial peptide transport system permease subunit
MILREAVLLGLAGVALGGCLAAIAQPLVSSFVQDVSIPVRPAFLTAGLVVVLVTLAAWVPARRAARIPPALASRAE